VSVRVEQRPHAPRELRLRLLDLLPRRHTPMIAPMTDRHVEQSLSVQVVVVVVDAGVGSSRA
jgi:hypothetical protein